LSRPPSRIEIVVVPAVLAKLIEVAVAMTPFVMFIVAAAEGVNTTAVEAVGTAPVDQNDVLLHVAGVLPVHVAVD
jgi:hypothetical protein